MAITIPDCPCIFSVFKFPFPVLWCPLRFPSINDVLFVFQFIRLIGKFMFDLCYLYLFTYTVVQTGLPYQMLFLSFNSNLMGATSKADIDYPTWAHGFTPAIYILSLCSTLFLFCLAFFGVCLLIILLVSSDFSWGSKPWNCIKVTNQINHINIYRTHLSAGENWTYIFSGECSCNFSTHVQNVTICIWFMGIQFIHSRKEDTECIGWYKSNYTTSNLQWNFVYSWYVSLSYRLITPIMPLGVVELGVRRHMLCLMTRNISLKQLQRGSMQIIKTPMEMSCHRT